VEAVDLDLEHRAVEVVDLDLECPAAVAVAERGRRAVAARCTLAMPHPACLAEARTQEVE
jgi:hypothetical protein